jgi:CheY-like chemotaxis protein
MEPVAEQPCVLIVEDEAIVRLNAVSILEDAGYLTVEATDSTDALVELCRNAAIRILFTDIDMPGGINGLELARRVRELRPDVAIIVTSGHNKPGPEEIPNGGRFISKPYSTQAVTDLVGELAQSKPS